MCRSRIWNTRNDIRLDIIPSCKKLPTAIPHLLDIHTLVSRRWISIVDPEEGTDLHLFTRQNQSLQCIARHHGNLARSKLPVSRITEIQERKALEGCTECAILLTNDDRRSSVFISCKVDALRRQDQHGHRTFDDLLCIADTIDEIILLIDNRSHKLCRIDLTVTHLKEMCSSLQNRINDFLCIVDLANGCNCKRTVMRTH